jgi:hypothetical protein
VLKQQIAFTIANDLSCVASQFAVGTLIPPTSSMGFERVSATLGVTVSAWLFGAEADPATTNAKAAKVRAVRSFVASSYVGTFRYKVP